MEPIGLTASCLTIAGCAYTIIKDLHDLRAKYKHVEEVIDTLCVQVSTLRAAVTGLSIWMERKPLSAAQETNLRRELRQSLDACGTLISALQRHVSRVKGGSDTLSARGKLRHILGEDDLKEFNRMLSLQVQALSFLVQVIQLCVF
jgi:outer membrane murein-binding lipoprotein Lpp